MAGILNFQQYIGGPDAIQVEQVFPSTQKTLVYNFGQDITGWTFSADQQTIVVDTVAFNRNTGQPNFSTSSVIGSFTRANITGSSAPTVISASAGTVKVILPANMYTGPVIPDARQNVPITVVGVTWSDASTPAQINTHRWALIQCWEPGVTIGDPVLATGYTAITLG
ncbi:hypothetical protein UFOVP109_33 [uncultured Caudovirales phage]|uniref:Uncharacterized protein n=1 Tax=uncultured Caudovirales phage TaxID=2100421 RepID=A0A6J7WM85_9CAUD|nr:hypothetical protein UFOVP109_33 [uncultured Caudovirales phage]CAB5218946.1 hypothetical protein UFOVP224_13 [uncultured Caudovirales phage]